MGEIKSAVFSVSVDNEAEIKQWLDDIGKSRDALETLFKAFVEMAQDRPLIRLTIHHQPEHNDGSGGGTASSGPASASEDKS